MYRINNDYGNDEQMTSDIGRFLSGMERGGGEHWLPVSTRISGIHELRPLEEPSKGNKQLMEHERGRERLRQVQILMMWMDDDAKGEQKMIKNETDVMMREDASSFCKAHRNLKEPLCWGHKFLCIFENRS